MDDRNRTKEIGEALSQFGSAMLWLALLIFFVFFIVVAFWH